MKIFPAIDIKDRKCVRLVKGDFDNKTEYEMSPVEQAEKYKSKLYPCYDIWPLIHHQFRLILLEYQLLYRSFYKFIKLLII